jgi:uncharacterized membrane protein YjjB (DUF3815 family)
MIDLLSILIQDAFWSGLAAFGFAMLFNVPQRALIACVSCGATGHAIRTLVIEMGSSIAPATFIGATVVGVMGYFFARWRKIPSVVFTVSGAIPMVPGVFAYQTMIALLQLPDANVTEAQIALADAAINGMATMLILGAIAVGIAAPSLLFERSKPVV